MALKIVPKSRSFYSQASQSRSKCLVQQYQLQKKTRIAPPKHAVSIDKTAVPLAGLRDELPRYKATDVPPASNGNTANRSNRMHQSNVSDDHSFQNGGPRC